MRVHAAIANAFVKEGTSVVFGLLGEGQIPWWSEMAKQPGVRFVNARDEGAALSMAEGWARVTGKVGVCSAMHGPGLSRLATSLVVAVKGRYPIVAYVSALARNDEKHTHYIDQKRFVEATGAAYIEVLKPDYAEDAVRDAFYRARVESRPVVLAVPLDIHNLDCDADGDDYIPSAAWYGSQQRIRPDADRLAEAVAALAACERPVILTGRGAQWSGARELIGRLADRIGAVTATSLLTKGMFAGDPYDAGISGGYATRAGIALFHEADCVLAVGASLNRNTLEGGYLYPNAKIIHLDAAKHVAIGSRQGSDIYLQADARAALEEIDAALADRAVRKTGFRTAEVKESLRRASEDPGVFEIAPGTVDPRSAARLIDEKLPANMPLMYGAGNQKAITLLIMTKPRAAHHYAALFGCIGQALPTAVGATVGLDGGGLCAIEGDSGALQCIQELDTAARYNLKLLYVVFNDEALGAEKHKMIIQGRDGTLAENRSPDFGAVGRAFGCRGRLAKTLEDVATGIDEFLAGDGPYVLDVRISPNVISIPHRRVHMGQDV